MADTLQDIVVVIQGADEKGNPGKEDSEPQGFVDVPAAATFKGGIRSSRATLYKLWNGGWDNRNPSTRIVQWIRKNRQPESRVVLIGMSSGGPNVFEVASALTQEKIGITYAAACDAAFDNQNDLRRNLTFQAGDSDNYFQGLGNAHNSGEWHGMVPNCKLNRSFNTDAEFLGATTVFATKKAATTAAGAFTGGLAGPYGMFAGAIGGPKLGQKWLDITSDFVDKVHLMAVKKGNGLAFAKAQRLLSQ